MTFFFLIGAAKAQELKPVPDEAPNMTDIDESIKKLLANNPELKSLNLNNIKVYISKYSIFQLEETVLLLVYINI